MSQAVEESGAIAQETIEPLMTPEAYIEAIKDFIDTPNLPDLVNDHLLEASHTLFPVPS